MRKVKFALMGLTGTLCVCMTSCAMTGAALAAAAAVLGGGTPAP